MCMTFLRYQEFYECPSPKFRGKKFTIIDYMDWYSHKYGDGLFTYPKDWGGFNIPSDIVLKLQNKIGNDWNKYDNEMCNIYQKCIKLNKELDSRFYLLAAVGEGETLRHEISHGFFYLNVDYKKKMTALVKTLKPSFRKEIYSTLKKFGYTSSVFIDEAQAYLSTGMEVFEMNFTDERDPFIKVYEEFYKK